MVKTVGRGDGSAPIRRNRLVEVKEAAIDVFWRKGYDGASVQDVADQVGVLKGSLYHYIHTKEDLLFWILEDVHVRSMVILDEVKVLDGAPLVRLRTFIERHVQWYLENVAEVTVYFRDWKCVEGDRLTLVRERRRGYDLAVRGLIEEARANADVHPRLEPKYASFFILSAVNHVPDWYRQGGQAGPAEIAGKYADLVIGALVGTDPRR